MDEQLTPEISPTIKATGPEGGAPNSGAAAIHKPVASYLHTLLVITIMIGVSVLSAKTMQSRLQAQDPRGPFGQYISTIIWLWLLAALSYLGMRRNKVSLRDVIGDRWQRFDDFLIDLAIAGGFWLAAGLSLAAVKFAMTGGHISSLQTLPEEAKNIAPLIPHTPREIVVWIVLSVSAGLCEEFVFRGYLQRQFSALTRNAAAGIALSAVFFALGHLYQGVQQMAVIGLYGAMFGTLAFFRRSLRPGMIAHAWQDTLSGLALSVLLPHVGK